MLQALPTLISGGLLAMGTLGFAVSFGANHALLWAIGVALGFTLHRGSFSFAGAFRLFFAEGRSAGIRAQMVMLALLVLVMLPATHFGALAGEAVRGIVFPAGLAVIIGAFLFGIGMQLGGGCASGTLYAAGGGDIRMVLTLLFFIMGASIAAWDSERWSWLPAPPSMTWPDLVGIWPALFGSLGVFACVALIARAIEKNRHGNLESILTRPASDTRKGWPLALTAGMPTMLNILTLWAAGRPWIITAAFPLWGSRVAEEVGWADPAFWSFWEDSMRTEAFLRPILADRTTVMDFGLIVGAFFAAAGAVRFRLNWRQPLRPLCASVLGGLLLGYGAVMASGCNISAYVAGIASGSLHGWLRILPGVAGNWVGLHLRPAFRL